MNYVTSLEEILWGITLVAVTMAIHGCGMLATLFTSHALKHGSGRQRVLSARRRGADPGELDDRAGSSRRVAGLGRLSSCGRARCPNASTSYYFALMQYTTVGSSFSLPLRWRLLDGMLPIAGLMTFAWSTGVLFTLAQEFQSTQLVAIHARRQARRARRQCSRRPDEVRELLRAIPCRTTCAACTMP